MARTQVKGQQVEDGSIQRVDLDTTTPGQAVITRILPGTGVVVSSTGADSGTGDVTISVSATGTVRQYIHNQVTPETQWTMLHEFGGCPEVIVLDETGERVYCDLYYPNASTVIAEFGEEFSGRAALTISQADQVGYEQVTASSTWVVVHNLNRYPDVVLFDTSMGNIRIYGDITYPSVNEINIVFNNPMLGKAYLI